MFDVLASQRPVSREHQYSDLIFALSRSLPLSLSLRLHIEIVYASDKKVLLILWFVREQTRAIGQLLFSVEFSLRGVCGLHDD